MCGGGGHVLDTGRLSAAEAVEGSALSLESVDDVDGGDGLSLGVLGVGDGVTDDVLEEGSEDEAGLVVDERGDSLDTTASGESADSRLGDAHDGSLERLLSESLGTGLAGNFAELAALASVDRSHYFNHLQLPPFKALFEPYLDDDRSILDLCICQI